MLPSRSEMPPLSRKAQGIERGLLTVLLAVVLSSVLGNTAAPAIDHGDLEEGETFAPPKAVASDAFEERMASSFTENRGQIRNPDVRFYVASRTLHVGFAKSAILLKVVQTGASSPGDERHPMMPAAQLPEPVLIGGVMLRLRFEGASDVSPKGRELQSHQTQFFLGSDASLWRTGARSYGAVVYEDLYRGVDLVYRASSAGVKYEFHVDAGASPEDVTLVYEGADRVAFDGAGNAWIHTLVGTLTDSAPVAFQGADQVPCAFVLRGHRSYGLRCHGVDVSRPLIVDPVLSATFLGGSGTDRGHAIAVDMDGNAYVTGETGSVDFPATLGAFDETNSGGIDAFVAKLDRALSTRIYTTYIGGGGEDRGLSIAVDAGGTVYVTGTTNSPDFPWTFGANDTTYNGGTDAFVVRLNAAGTGLVYATYFGGTGEDWGNCLAVGPGGSVLLTGSTTSADFPRTLGANDTVLGGASDAFVAKLNVTGGSLDYSTYLGGAGNESGLSIAVDSGGNAYLTGMVDSNSPDFPTTLGVFQETFGGGPWDAFVAKANPTGTSLLYLTFLGGNGYDDGSGIAVDDAGNAYVAGSSVNDTDATNLNTTAGVYDTTHNGGTDAFVAKVDPTGTALVYGTFLGGGKHDYGYGIAVDGAGNAYVAGQTHSADFPTTQDALSSLVQSRDGFVTKLTPDGVALNYSTFLGGGDFDFVKSIALDSVGNVYATGETDSHDFPVTPGVWDTDLNRSGNPLNWTDAFVAKFVWPADLSVIPADIAFVPPIAVNPGESLTINVSVHNEGVRAASSARVRFFDGSPTNAAPIGADQLIPEIVPFGGTGRASVTWTAWPAGPHDICVVVDPDDEIGELNESNNEACATIEVTIVLPPGSPFPPIWIVLAVTIGIAVSISWWFEFLRRSFWIPFAVMWARLSRDDILDNKKRGMVVGYLAANPAANFAAIRGDLRMAMGTLTYHLWVLEKEGEIKSWRDGRFRRYAPSGHRVAELQPRLTDIEIVLLTRIRETSGLTQKALAKDVGVSQPAISYHISRMAAMGVLRVERRGRRKRYTANLGEIPGDEGSQADPGDVAGTEPLDETDDFGPPR